MLPKRSGKSNPTISEENVLSGQEKFALEGSDLNQICEEKTGHVASFTRQNGKKQKKDTR